MTKTILELEKQVESFEIENSVFCKEWRNVSVIMLDEESSKWGELYVNKNASGEFIATAVHVEDAAIHTCRSKEAIELRQYKQENGCVWMRPWETVSELVWSERTGRKSYRIPSFALYLHGTYVTPWRRNLREY